MDIVSIPAKLAENQCKKMTHLTYTSGHTGAPSPRCLTGGCSHPAEHSPTTPKKMQEQGAQVSQGGTGGEMDAFGR